MALTAGASVSLRGSKRSIAMLPLEGILEQGAGLQQYVAVAHLYTWVKRDNVEQSFLSRETTQQ